jgi:programmed cell death 6-interacting protein
LEYAKTLFAAGIERGSNGDLVQCKEWLRRTERALTDAKKDNDFIYHERIPEVKNLTPVAKAAVAKVTLPLPSPMGSAGKDLFEALCPVAVHQALAAYEVRKQEIVNREVTKLKDATNMLNVLLSSMNLPAALEDTSGKFCLPC